MKAQCKRICVGLLFCLMLTLMAGMMTFAASSRVDDAAGLLSEEQISSLSAKASAAAEQTGFDLMLVTTDDTNGRSAQSYAEDYYLAHTNSDDGAVCLIDMDNREIYIATSGMVIRYLTDQRLERTLDRAYDRISGGDYAGTLEEMLSGITNAYAAGIPGGQYNYNTDTGETDVYQEQPKGVSPLEGLFSAIAGLFGGGGLFGAVKRRYQMKSGGYVFDFRGNSKVKLQVKQDRVINRFVTRKHIPKVEYHASSGGGGSHQSSTHIGSGGHTFGGGGRKF